MKKKMTMKKKDMPKMTLTKKKKPTLTLKKKNNLKKTKGSRYS